MKTPFLAHILYWLSQKHITFDIEMNTLYLFLDYHTITHSMIIKIQGRCRQLHCIIPTNSNISWSCWGGKVKVVGWCQNKFSSRVSIMKLVYNITGFTVNKLVWLGYACLFVFAGLSCILYACVSDCLSVCVCAIVNMRLWVYACTHSLACRNFHVHLQITSSGSPSPTIVYP